MGKPFSGSSLLFIWFEQCTALLVHALLVKDTWRHLTEVLMILKQITQKWKSSLKEISIFKKLVSRRKHEVLQNWLVNGCSDVGFKKHNGPTPADDIAPPNHHRLWKLNTGLHATLAMSFSTLPPDSRTLVSKLNTKLALIWKRTTVQFFFSLAQVRRLWRCLWFRSGLTRGIRQL